MHNSNSITEKHFQNLCSYSRRNVTVRVHHSFLGIFIKNVGSITASVIISKKLRSKLQRLCIKNSLQLRNILHGTSGDTRSLQYLILLQPKNHKFFKYYKLISLLVSLWILFGCLVENQINSRKDINYFEHG